jgi:hypothetical protein
MSPSPDSYPNHIINNVQRLRPANALLQILTMYKYLYMKTVHCRHW